jgi:hypothetical protein
MVVPAALALLMAVLLAGVPATPVYATPPKPSPSPTTTPPSNDTDTETDAGLTSAEQRIENVIAAAQAYIGVPYKLGAEGPDLMDCSGLIYRSFMDAGEGRRMSGARLGVRSYVKWFAARGRLVLDEADAVRGDLAIWGAGQHMGIYLGDGRVISAVTSGVKVHALHGISLELSGFLHPNWDGAGKVEPLDPSLLLDQSETPVALVPPSAWAPALDPSLDGAQPERLGVERVDMRGPNSRTFENADGTFTTEFHSSQIYYQPADSPEWLPIDLRFHVVEGKHRRPDSIVVDTSPVAVNVFEPGRAEGFLTLASGERSLSVARVNAGGDAPPVISDDGRTIDYTDFYGDGVGLRVLARPDGIRAFLVLGEAPAANDFAFRLAGEGLTLTLEPDGSAALRDELGLAVALVPRPVLLDSTDVDGSGGGLFAGATSLNVATDEAGEQLLTVHVARRFLEEAVYPAFIDLSIADFPAVASGAELAGVSSRHQNSGVAGDERPELPSYGELWLGRQPGTRNDSAAYVRFDDSVAVPDDAQILGRALEVYPYWGNPLGVDFNVRGLGADWTTATLTWATQPQPTGDLGTITLTPGTWSTLDLTDAAPGDLDYGMVLTAARPGAASWTRIIARDQSDVMAFGPRLVVTWQPAAPPAWLAPKLLTLPSAESPVIASAA